MPSFIVSKLPSVSLVQPCQLFPTLRQLSYKIKLIHHCSRRLCFHMERRSARLANHQPFFRHFDHDIGDDDARNREAEKKRESRERQSVDCKRRRLQNDAIHVAIRRAESRPVLTADHSVQSATIHDARCYAAQIQNTCIFYMCCVCL